MAVITISPCYMGEYLHRIPMHKRRIRHAGENRRTTKRIFTA